MRHRAIWCGMPPLSLPQRAARCSLPQQPRYQRLTAGVVVMTMQRPVAVGCWRQ
ncbi:hypothetical protein [Geobacillus sp. CCR]